MNRKSKGDDPSDAETGSLEAAAAAVGHLYEAKERLKDAASAAGSAVRSATASAAQAVREDFSANREAVTDPLHDAAAAGRNAASEAGTVAGAEVERLMQKSRELWGSAEGVIRQHPVAAFGTAFAIGWLIAKLGRRNG